jgi:hypothetical protein
MADEVDELTKDGKLQLELDRACYYLDALLPNVEVLVFDDEKSEVHDDYDQVDGEQLP